MYFKNILINVLNENKPILSDKLTKLGHIFKLFEPLLPNIGLFPKLVTRKCLTPFLPNSNFFPKSGNKDRNVFKDNTFLYNAAALWIKYNKNL